MIGVRNNGRHIRFKQTIPYNKKPIQYIKTRRFNCHRCVPKVIAKAPSTTASDTLSNVRQESSITGVK
jgi:hypothetical protein